MEISSRHHLRSDAVRDLETTLAESFGIEFAAEGYERVEFADEETDLVLASGEPLAVYFDGEPAPTVRGANTADPTKRIVTVDAGAVSFVSDGADVMRPGITETTDDIEYMVFPRLSAIAELGWTPNADTDWTDFSDRLALQGPRWDWLGLNYYQSDQIDWQ